MRGRGRGQAARGRRERAASRAVGVLLGERSGEQEALPSSQPRARSVSAWFSVSIPSATVTAPTARAISRIAATKLPAARAIVEPVDERLRDLDRGERELLEACERRMPRAEVVDRELEPARDEPPGPLDRPGGILHRRGLRDLERDHARLEAVGRDRPLDPPHRLLVEKLIRGDVDVERSPPYSEKVDRQRKRVAHACCMTRASIAPIRPVSSASGRNSVGGSTPRVGWFHRTSASKPTIHPSASRTIGW